MTLQSFIVANPAVALLLLLISSLTCSCVIASPFDNSETDTTAESPLLTQPELVEKIHTARDGDRMINTTPTPVTTTGTCKAILPDGRLQTVVYTCAPTGYSAVVQFHKAGNQSANASPSSSTQVNATQQPLQPITEILFRSTTESSRVTTGSEKMTAESTSIQTASSLSTKKMNPESMLAIVPPHRFHIGTGEKIRTVSLVQLQHSLPSLPISSSTSSTTPATTGRRRSTTVAPPDDDVSSTTPAATKRRRMRVNNPSGVGTTQSEPPL